MDCGLVFDCIFFHFTNVLAIFYENYLGIRVLSKLILQDILFVLCDSLDVGLAIRLLQSIKTQKESFFLRK